MGSMIIKYAIAKTRTIKKYCLFEISISHVSLMVRNERTNKAVIILSALVSKDNNKNKNNQRMLGLLRIK
jgi:hypothetical protein